MCLHLPSPGERPSDFEGSLKGTRQAGYDAATDAEAKNDDDCGWPTLGSRCLGARVGVVGVSFSGRAREEGDLVGLGEDLQGCW